MTKPTKADEVPAKPEKKSFLSKAAKMLSTADEVASTNAVDEPPKPSPEKSEAELATAAPVTPPKAAEKPANASPKKSFKSSPAAQSISTPQRRRVLPDTPDYLIPRLGKLPVADAMHFVTAHLISGSSAADTRVFSAPLKLKPIAAAQLPASGVLLTHEQGWYARGLALGNLLHSITLAPGEVTQVAVVEWHRQEKGSATEATSQDDSTTAQDERKRAVDDVQQSSLSEHQLGGSAAASAAVSAQGGYATPFFSAGGGVNTTSGISTSYSDGTRDLSLSENQRINETTVRNAQASRSRRAAVVRETSQAESEQLTTRVVANYNHTHALTMMYFEVIEVFDLTTKVTNAERLIYLPMEVETIDEKMLHRFGGQFAQAAESRGDIALAVDIKRWIEREPSMKAVAAGWGHTLALRSDNTVTAWGLDATGQCSIPSTLTDVVAIAANGHHSLALKRDGTVVAWGAAKQGESNIPPDLREVTAISAGFAYCLALKRDLTVVGWGDNEYGMSTPPLGLSGVSAIAAGGSQSLALKVDGTVVAWGQDLDGSTTVPAGLSGVIAISAGGSHNLALKKDGSVVGWGRNTVGQTSIPAGLSGVIAISAGGAHSLALKSDGSVVGWGGNEKGQSKIPEGLSGVIAIAAGWGYSVALKSDGAVVCWGGNDYGQWPEGKLNKILERLNRLKLFYNQVVWVSQEPGAVIENLRGVKWPANAARALSESVDPRPVTLTGNYVGYRWHFDNKEEREKFLEQYIDATDDEAAMSHSATVAVASGGVFGEAVLGQAVSAEKIDLTRFWKWQDSPIPILPSQINPLSAGGRARDINTATGQLNDSAAKLDQLSALPDPAGFSAASQMMTSNIFRDMSGSSVIKDLALAASQHAADGADSAAKLASQNLASFMNFAKDIAQMSIQQQGGMDTTTMGGLQPDPEEGAEGGGGGLGEAAEEVGSLAEDGAEVGEVAGDVAPFLLV